ncbi:MAG TPA: hypothetical protein VF022_04395 [Rhodanobacteraceae bacterium]|jgi:hypothetical protein
MAGFNQSSARHYHERFESPLAAGRPNVRRLAGLIGRDLSHCT